MQTKLFKFKKNANQTVANRAFGDPLLSNPYSSIFNFSDEHQLQTADILHRKIAQQPYKVLDAPNLSDDFYLNLVDWSLSNILAVALGSSVYIWNACTSTVSQLCDLGEDN